MAETRRRRFSIFLPAAFVAIEADEIQFAGPTLIIWRDGSCVAQFTQWVEEGVKEGEKPKPQLSIVSPLRPPEPGQAPAPPEPAA